MDNFCITTSFQSGRKLSFRFDDEENKIMEFGGVYFTNIDFWCFSGHFQPDFCINSYKNVMINLHYSNQINY